MKTITFDSLFDRLKRKGVIVPGEKPAVYRMFWLAAKGMLCLLACAWASAAEVGLTWTANTEPDIAKYRIYQSTNGTFALAAETTGTNVTLSNLVAGATYTFYATAVNSVAMESVPSVSVSYTPLGGLPVIVSHPLSTTANYGDTASFSINASGAVAYQWYRNGIPLANSTLATLTIARCSDADAGKYMCRVSNGLQFIFSNEATLTVKHVPPGQVKDFKRL
jgi:hypothetical protein